MEPIRLNKWNLELRVSFGTPGKNIQNPHIDLNLVSEAVDAAYILSNSVIPHSKAKRRYILLNEGGFRKEVRMIEVSEEQPHWTDSPLQEVTCFREGDEDNFSYRILIKTDKGYVPYEEIGK